MLTANAIKTDLASQQSAPVNIIVKRAIPISLAIFVFLLPTAGLIDRGNYEVYFATAPVIFLRYVSQGFVSVLVNEPVWLGFSAIMGFALSPEIAGRVLSAFNAFVIAYFLVSHCHRRYVLLILILCSPFYFQPVINHLRQGMAISLFLLALQLDKRYVFQFFLMCCLPFIHASFFITLPVFFFFTALVRLRLAHDVRVLSALFCGSALIAAFGFAARSLGARQATQGALNNTEISGIAVLVWGPVLVFLCIQGKSLLRQHAFAIASTVIYLLMYFFLTHSARVFANAIPLVLIAIMAITGRKGQFLRIAFGGFIFLLILKALGSSGYGYYG